MFDESCKKTMEKVREENLRSASKLGNFKHTKKIVSMGLGCESPSRRQMKVFCVEQITIFKMFHVSILRPGGTKPPQDTTYPP